MSLTQNRGAEMNKDQVKGTIDDVAGRAKRQVGEWTGDTNAQMKGLGQQAKGKAEKALGNAKDAVREGQNQVKGQAKKAWESAKGSVAEGKEEAQRGREAEKLQDEGDLDRVETDVNESSKSHIPQRCTERDQRWMERMRMNCGA
jgi:uncharacterized protein YjbJ (UPF0337 family)